MIAEKLNSEFGRTLSKKPLGPHCDFNGSMILHRLFLVFFAFFPSIYCDLVYSGQPNGPFVVLFDFGQTPGASIKIIKDYMDSDRDGNFCDQIARSPIILLKKRPDGLNDKLVRAALIAKDVTAIKRVQKILIDFRYGNDITQGLDGVMAFTNDGSPRMLALGIKGGVSAVPLKFEKNSTAVIHAFCAAVPNIYRN